MTLRHILIGRRSRSIHLPWPSLAHHRFVRDRNKKRKVTTSMRIWIARAGLAAISLLLNHSVYTNHANSSCPPGWIAKSFTQGPDRTHDITKCGHLQERLLRCAVPTIIAVLALLFTFAAPAFTRWSGRPSLRGFIDRHSEFFIFGVAASKSRHQQGH